MCEPWCWTPEMVSRLDDGEIEAIRMAQAERLRRAERSQPGQPGPLPEKPPPAAYVGGRAWAFLSDMGLTPEQAEQALRTPASE
jgi:hypothetical protein